MAIEQLGNVTIKSGMLTILDFGFAGAFGGAPDGANAARAAVAQGQFAFTHADAPAVIVPYLPVGTFPVSCVRIDDGEHAGLRQAVMIDFVPNPVPARTMELGRVLVDNARIGMIDIDALQHWNENDPVDGRADVAFWGLHEAEVAARFNAPKLGEDGYGFANLPIADAEAFAGNLHQLKESGELRFAYDYRPHTHPFYLLAQIRKHPNEAGILQVGGMGMCGFATTWGDGEFPVVLDLDAQNQPVRCGIFFATEEAIAGMREVNGR